MNPVDYKYIISLSSRLRNFRQNGPAEFQASCPLCGDSKKNKRKARFYIYERDGVIWTHCWNECGAISFKKFLDLFDPLMASQYKAEKFLGNKFQAEEIILQPIVKKESSYNDEEFANLAYRCSDLSDHTDAKLYLRSRLIPERFYDRIFYTDSFKSFTKHFGQEIKGPEEKRLIFPFYDEDKKIFAYSARVLDKKTELRYVNIILDETKPKIFGLDRWKRGDKTYVVEGAIDSLFITNTLATGGGDIVSVLRNHYFASLDDTFIVVYDNESHSRATKRKLEKAITQGFKVCIWPSYSKGKDINQMIIKGQSSLDIQKIIDDNTFSGMAARLQLSTWSKV